SKRTMTMRRNLEENRSTPLHLTARSGSIDSVRKLLASGADRLQRDASGYYKHYVFATFLKILRIPYVVAMKFKHRA
ncbi:hypothetical protein HID58_046770, partial [Brassica napus]